MTTTYYDTADRALSRRGLTLRVREANGRFVQTVKANGKARTDVLARSEWEDEIASALPDSRLPKGVAEALHPLFATAVKRTTITLEASPSLTIEAAIDRGEIRGFGNAAIMPISEIELELKRGEPGALFGTTLELLSTAPLHVEVRSKFERGCAAVAGEDERPKAERSSPLILEPAMSVEAALQRIGRSCLAHLLRNESAALAGDPEGTSDAGCIAAHPLDYLGPQEDASGRRTALVIA